MLKMVERVMALFALALLLLLPTASAADAPPCTNEGIRAQQASAQLPDCRAYELVSPSDSNGRPLLGVSDLRLPSAGALFETQPITSNGDNVAFMTYNGPVGEAGFLSGTWDVSGVQRLPDGWSLNRRFGPGGEQAVQPIPGGIAADHTYAFTDVAPVFKPGNNTGHSSGGTLAGDVETVYVSKPDGTFELVGIGTVGEGTVVERLAQGRYISPGGQHVLFSTGRLKSGSLTCEGASVCPVRRLAPEAPPEGTGAVYDRSVGGPTKVVSLLPGDAIPGKGEDAAFQGSSEDGATVAFKINGSLFIRVPDEEDGETFKVAEGDPVYAGLFDGGRYLFYVAGGENGTIHRFDTATKEDVEINPTAEGEVVNVSDDGSHVYFISQDVIGTSEENEWGDAAIPPATGNGTLSAGKGTGTVTAGSNTVTNVSTTTGELSAGMSINGSGIPVGTTITETGAGTLTLSQAASEDGTHVELSAGSNIVTGVSATKGEFLVGMGIKGEGIPFGTIITAVGPGTLSLSNVASESGTVTLAGGFPNFYVWSETSKADAYLTTVAPSDLEKTSNEGQEEKEDTNGMPALTNWTDWAVTPDRADRKDQGPGADSSRTTPDGNVLIFESKAKLTGYENAGHTEIYRYDDGNGSLTCVSCNFGQSASGYARLQLLTLVPPPDVIHNVSDDGSRVYFESFEALLPEDVDTVNDIYEWRGEPGGGSSRSLISSGRSDAEIPPLEQGTFAKWQPKPNVIFGITPSGSDVVFLAQDELVPGAGSGGTPALYDARIGGGFPLSQASPPCVEENCHPPNAFAPLLESPHSAGIRGSGNVKARRRHRCHHPMKHKSQRGCSKHHSTKKKHRKKSVASSSAAAGSSTSQSELSTGGSATPKPIGATGSSSVTLAGGEFEDFGIESVGAEVSTSEASAHPDFTTRIALNHFIDHGHAGANARPEDISVKLPPGLIGNPNAVSRCSTAEFLAFANCPLPSQVGIAKVLAAGFEEVIPEPLYNLEPPHPDNEIARLGFIAGIFPVFIDIKVRSAGDYGVTATVHHGPGQTSLLVATTTLWGSPDDESHDEQRLVASEASKCASTGTACLTSEGKREVPRSGEGFITNPSACQGGSVNFDVTSYQRPGEIFSASAALDPVTFCENLPFAPSFTAEPTTNIAGAPTGLKTKFVLPQHLGAKERATATMREAQVTLPSGMQIAAGAANWIGTCSDEQVGFHDEVDAHCPEASKLGTATIVSPYLPRPLEGSLYQRTPAPGHQFGLWLVSDDLGLHVKIPGELRPDPNTGRLTAAFTDLPQVPAEEIDFNIWGGARAPLQNPDRCGTYTTDYSFAPHSSDPVVAGSSQMTIHEGCSKGFDPKLTAGVTNPVAGKYSPLIVDMVRSDADQALGGFSITLPDGELAKLRGVPLCPDSVATTGSCPVDSAIGHLTAATGPGSEPLWVPQPGKATPRVYLAGPYEGAPFSIVTVVPAQAGPFDLGDVVVRSGLGLEPDTNRAVVNANPLPQFFEGVGLTYRRMNVVVDRSGFSLNPTDCRPMRVNSTVISTQGTVAHPTSPFQVRGCKRLKFEPKLSLRLAGGTKRAEYPSLTAVLKARKGDANIASASVALPHSEFLAQEHIGTICTRKQFAVAKCPKNSVYGQAKVWTPLLGKPLEGPVYLRSSDNLLPDLVAALGGELEVNLVGRIDSNNGGIRTTFEAVPDAPVSKFVLTMKGGAKGLLTNSTNICQGKHRETVKLVAQNGRVLNRRPLLTSTDCRNRTAK